jgi:Carboxypeptidase regulatory-like domain/TonB dependent receptor
MKFVCKIVFVLIFAASFCVSTRTQQVTATLRGTAYDPSGAVVSAASITATQIETGFSRAAATDAQGDFVLVELPVGHYRLEADAKGFQRFVREGIILEVNQAAFVAVRLALGTGTSQIEVSADAPLIENSSSTLGKTVDKSTIQDLPLNGRHFTQLGMLQPGVAPITHGLSQAGDSLRDGQAYAVNGQRPESNNFLIDGADNFNNVDGGFVMEPPVDAIAEFRILTHTANAEFGHSTGSTANIVTRSGTNSYHGSLWEFLRNDAFDAKSFFAQSVEPLKRNQYGGTFGGPIKRDKTFFFLYYEGLRERAGETVKTTVPSIAERSGDFSELCTGLSSTAHFDSNGNCVDSSGPRPDGQIFNVFAASPQPLPHNQVPFIDPVSQNVLTFYPLPNSSNNSFVSTQSKSTDNDQFGVRLDHYLTPRDTLNFRYIFSQGNVVDPLSTSGANAPGFPVGEEHRAQNFVATETHTFSPNLVALGRISFLRNRFFFNEHLNHTDPASLGFQYTPTLAAAFGPPFVQVAGFASVGDPITGPRQSWDSNLGVNGSLTWIRGRHELKFGGGYSYDRLNTLFGIATNGFFVFVPAPFTNSFANFLIGQPAFFLQGGGDPSRNLRGHAVNFYAQDIWKLSSRLTFNYGLRYEIPFPYTEQKDRQNLWIPGRQSVIFPTAPVGLLYPGDSGVLRGLIQTDHKAFAPRVGLAWDPTGRGKWLVSSAYGIFYDPYYTGQGGPLQTPNSAPPYLQTPQRSFPSFDDPFNGTNPFTGGFAQPMTLLTLDPNLSLPYAQDWNFNIQRAFGDSWLFEIGYIGTKGTKLPRFIEANPAVDIPGETTQNNADQRRLFSGCTIAEPSPCTYSSVGEIAGVANSTYHALQTSLRKRFTHGFSMLGSYTLSKTLDDVSSFNITGSASQSTAGENDLAQNPFDLRAEHGRSMFDARHRLVLSYQWELPFFRSAQGWQGAVLGGWQANGITTFQSGTPFTVYDSTGVSAQGGAPEISGFPSDRPNLVGDPTEGTCPNGAHTGTPDCWYNPSAFQQLDPTTQIGQFGNAGRNIVQGPGYQQWDFSAMKNFRFAENKNLQFRAEFFNLFNRANFGIPVNDLNVPDDIKGNIQTSQSGRLVQFALKFLF